MSVAMIVEKNDTAVPLELSIDQEGVGGVIGQSPTVAIRRGDSTTLYFDWSDGTFKAAAWGTQYATMTEVQRGHYVRLLDPSTSAGILVGQILLVEFRVDDGGSIKGDVHDVLSIVNEIYNITGGGGATPADIADAVWDELLAGHLLAGSTGEALSDAAAGGAGLTPGQVTAAVWDEPAAIHVAAGTFGLMVNEIRIEEEEDDFTAEGI
jgi:hypothetical protein